MIVGLTPLLSVAVATKFTTLLFSCVILAGHVMLGATKSVIVTPNVHWRLMLELGWVAVTVTVVVCPIVKDELDGCE